MGVNWKVRIKNKAFWVALIPAVALLIQAVAALFGWQLDLTETTGKLLAVVDAVFAVLVILGIVVDPTTKGIADSQRALSYITPWVDDPTDYWLPDEEEEEPEEKEDFEEDEDNG